MPRRVAALQEFLTALDELVEAARELTSQRSIARLYLAIVRLYNTVLPEVFCSEDEAWIAYFRAGERINDIVTHANDASVRGFLRTTTSGEHPVVQKILGESEDSTMLFPDSDWDPGVWQNLRNGLYALCRATHFKSWMPHLGARSPIGARGLLRDAIQSPALVCTESASVRSARGRLVERSSLPAAAESLGLKLAEWTLVDLAQARRQTLLAAGFHAAKGWESGSASELAKGVNVLNDFIRFFQTPDGPPLQAGAYYEALDGSWSYASILRELEACGRPTYLGNLEKDLIIVAQTSAGGRYVVRTFSSPSYHSKEADTPVEVARFGADPLGYILAHQHDWSMSLSFVAGCRDGIAELRRQCLAASVAAPLFGLVGIAAGKLVGGQLFPGLPEPVIEAVVGAIGYALGWKLFQQPELVFSGWNWEEELASPAT